jgi:hypothetical protein
MLLFVSSCSICSRHCHLDVLEAQLGLSLGARADTKLRGCRFVRCSEAALDIMRHASDPPFRKAEVLQQNSFTFNGEDCKLAYLETRGDSSGNLSCVWCVMCSSFLSGLPFISSLFLLIPL